MPRHSAPIDHPDDLPTVADWWESQDVFGDMYGPERFGPAPRLSCVVCGKPKAAEELCGACGDESEMAA